MAEEAQPPYVEFITKAVEDRNASIDAGHYVGKDVDFAVVTARGSRDRVEHEIDYWLAKIAQDARDYRIPAGWVTQWKEAYALWKSGQSSPENGTSVKEWPVASPAIVQQLLSMRVTTVEALAECNEETMSRLGMGGRALRQKAVDWLASSKSTGKTVEELSALRIELEQTKTQRDELQAKVNKYESERRSEESKPGRAPGNPSNSG